MYHYPAWQVAVASFTAIAFMITLRIYLDGVARELMARWDYRQRKTRRTAQKPAQGPVEAWTGRFRQPQRERVTLNVWEEAAFMEQTHGAMPHRPSEPGMPECTCATCTTWRSYQW